MSKGDRPAPYKGAGLFAFGSPLREDFAVHLLFLLRIPLDYQNHGVSYQEIGVLMLVGVITHAHGPIREIAKHAAVFAGDHGLPSAADGMPLSAPP